MCVLLYDEKVFICFDVTLTLLYHAICNIYALLITFPKKVGTNYKVLLSADNIGLKLSVEPY